MKKELITPLSPMQYVQYALGTRCRMHVNTPAFALLSLAASPLAVLSEDRWLKLEAHVVGPGGGPRFTRGSQQRAHKQNKRGGGERRKKKKKESLI